MMKKMKFFILIILMFGLSACGSTEKDSKDTEKLSVGTGLSFESEGAVNTGNSVNIDGELTATDLDGMTEEVVQIIKLADVYSKPSKEASTIGAVAAQMNVAVYGLTEDQKWMVVSYNGRVGYIEASAFERELIQSQTVIVPTTPTNSNNTTTSRPDTGTTNTSNSNTGNSSSGNTDTGTSEENQTESSENSNTSMPEPPNTEETGTVDPEVPSGGSENNNEPPVSEGGMNEEPDSEIPDMPSDGGESNEEEEPPQNTEPPEESTDEPIEPPEIPDGSEANSEGNTE